MFKYSHTEKSTEILTLYRHWMDKNCVPWAKEYFNKSLLQVTLPHENQTITIVSIPSLTGDCDVTQRKGKVNCLFELKIEFVAEIKSDDSTESVTIVLPEFEHDYDSSDFIFTVKTTNQAHKAVVNKVLLPHLVDTVFLNFQKDLIATHEKDLKHNTN